MILPNRLEFVLTLYKFLNTNYQSYTHSSYPDAPPENLPKQNRIEQMNIGCHRADEKTK